MRNRRSLEFSLGVVAAYRNASERGPVSHYDNYLISVCLSYFCVIKIFIMLTVRMGTL